MWTGSTSRTGGRAQCRTDREVQEAKGICAFYPVYPGLAEEGETLKLISQVCKKLRKAKKPEGIADDLEEDVSVIKRICEAAKGCGEEYSTEQIFKKLKRWGMLLNEYGLS